MQQALDKRWIYDFLGSAHVFASAVTEAIETRLLRETLGTELSVSQLKLIELVSLGDAHTIGDVAFFLGVSNAAASKTVDKLVRRMLLRRRQGADRRAIHLSLTEEGRRLLKCYDEARQAKLLELFEPYSPEELQKTREVLDRISAELVKQLPQRQGYCLQCGIYFRDSCLLRDLLSRKCYHQRNAGRVTA
jgi:MarR family transcriptional regulator, 2-MHQ and catechol-resistance regulon repressor